MDPLCARHPRRPGRRPSLLHRCRPLVRRRRLAPSIHATAATIVPPRGGLTLVQIPIGPFTRGEGKAAHPVTLTRPYALGVVPVTVAEYRRFDPDHKCPGGDDCPVTEVSWWRARLYAAWVGCRLPTESEWENACRAGTETRFWSGDADADGERVGWSNAKGAKTAYPVALKPANPNGLYDMHGNVYEWMADWDAPYPPRGGEALVDPAGPPTGTSRVLRGGAFTEPTKNNRAARRSRWQPRFTSDNTGFRLAQDIPPNH
ncbi:MAG: SUMF1/EgtB/PvdO family nonheme iron enzyme [Myxococcales bacterium]|nr:SUMF1/EgtB/PvdO family nonheme iron enzyme [Myxococcales bacterium]